MISHTVFLRGLEAYKFLSVIVSNEHPYEFRACSPAGNVLRLWIDGCETAHHIVLCEDNTWKVKTVVQI